MKKPKFDPTGRPCRVSGCAVPTSKNPRGLCEPHFGRWQKSADCKRYLAGGGLAIRHLAEFCRMAEAEDRNGIRAATP